MARIIFLQTQHGLINTEEGLATSLLQSKFDVANVREGGTNDMAEPPQEKELESA